MILSYRIIKESAVVCDIIDAPKIKNKNGILQNVYIIQSANKIDTVFSNNQEIVSSRSQKIKIIDINNFAFMNIEINMHKWIFFSSAVIAIALLLTFLIIIPMIFEIIFIENKIAREKISIFLNHIKNLLEKIKYLDYFIVTFCALFIVYMLLLVPDKIKSYPIISFIEIYKIFEISFNSPSEPTNYLILFSSIISLFPLIGIFKIMYSFLNIKIEDKTKYTTLSKSLNVLTLFLALLVSAATVATGLQREIIISHSASLEILCPPELTYLYGAAYSLLLIIICVPVYVTMQSVGAKLGIDLAQAQKQSGQHWWDIGEKTIQQLKLALSVILPFLTSVIQEAIS